jgi:hypothetical protein
VKIRNPISARPGPTPVSLGDVRRELWCEADPDKLDRAVLLEQYKIYVEMADRTSARRSTTNTFFLTLNSLILTLAATHASSRPPRYLALAAVVLLIQCGSWFGLVRSYRRLNEAKYLVIGALEEQLPASPYWRGEWTALGRGLVRTKYWTLTSLEQWVPFMFAAVYVAAFIFALAA